MNLNIFEESLDRYGGDLANWPPRLRAEAADLVATSVEARTGLQAMAEVERFLVASRPRYEGIDRFAETASRQRQARPVPRAAHRAAWGAAAMVVLMAGLFVGDIRPTTMDDGVEVLVATSLEPMGVSDVD